VTLITNHPERKRKQIMNAQKNHPFAWSIDGLGLITLVGLAIVGILIPITIVSLLLQGGTMKLAIAVLVISAILAGIVIAAFKVKIKRFGSRLLEFTTVPIMTRRILQWRLGSPNESEDSSSQFDESRCYAARPGLLLLSPLFWETIADVSVRPRVIAQKPFRVKATDGPDVDVDVQLTCRPVNVIAFQLRVGSFSDLTDLLNEILQSALQQATSVTEEMEVPLLNPDGQESYLEGWDCSAEGLSFLKQPELVRMGQAVTSWLNFWFYALGFGLVCEVRVNNIAQQELMNATMEAAAAKELEIGETLAEQQAAAAAARAIATALPEMNKTVLGALVVLPYLLRGFSETFRGRRSSAAAKKTSDQGKGK